MNGQQLQSIAYRADTPVVLAFDTCDSGGIFDFYGAGITGGIGSTHFCRTNLRSVHCYQTNYMNHLYEKYLGVRIIISPPYSILKQNLFYDTLNFFKVLFPQ